MPPPHAGIILIDGKAGMELRFFFKSVLFKFAELNLNDKIRFEFYKHRNCFSTQARPDVYQMVLERAMRMRMNI